MQTQVKNPKTLDPDFTPSLLPTTVSVRVPRRHAGHQVWAPPPGRSTAARSPMGWTRAPARGPAVAPPPSVSRLDLLKEFFHGAKGEASRGQKEIRGRVRRGLRPGGAVPTAAGKDAGRGEETRRRCCFSWLRCRKGGGKRMEGKEQRAGCCGLGRAGRRPSPPPARLPAAGQMKGRRRRCTVRLRGRRKE
jgi:hypothetical protein